MRLRSSSVSALAVVLLASMAFASSPVATARAAAASDETPTFSAQTEIVTVDALVVDGQGKPVSRLSRADFRLLEDGRPQTLTAFEEIEAKLTATAPPPSVTPPSASGIETNLAEPKTRRTFGIVFDDIHIDVPHAAWARKALQDFAARETRPGDQLLLLTTSDGRLWTSTRGAESQPFGEALARLSSRRPNVLDVSLTMTPVEAMKIAHASDYEAALRVRRRRAILSGMCRWVAESAACECNLRSSSGGRNGMKRPWNGANEDGCQEPAGAETAQETYSLAVQGVERTLRVLRDAIEALGAEHDRKVLIMVSEGFIQDPSIRGFREVRDVAARANVVLHFLDARGLALRPEVYGVEAARGLPAEDLTATTADWRQESEGARMLAEDTGGLSLQTNDLGAALRRIADESRVTYLLGYEPGGARRDGVFHKLRVEVLRPGLRVRARAGYFAPKIQKGRPAAVPTAVERALRGTFDATGIPLRLATAVLGKAPADAGSLEVLVAGELRRDSLEMRVVDGQNVAEPRLLLAVGSRDHATRTSEWKLTVPAPAAEPGGHDAALWHPFVTRLPVEPGEHRIRLVVESGSRGGSVTTDLVVPKPDDERVSVLLSNERAADRRLPLLPLARRTFASSDTLYCWLELQGVRQDGERHRLSASFRALSDAGAEWAEGLLEQAPDGRPAWLVGIPLEQASPGEHTLAISVRDEDAGKTTELREAFRIEDVPQGRALEPADSRDLGEGR